jgi:hypothetical protein
MTATPQPVTLAHHVQHSQEVLVQEVGGEAVLLDLASERYFGLDPVGARIWALLDQDQPLQEVLETLCGEYDAPRERLQEDLLELVATLADAGLVTVH